MDSIISLTLKEKDEYVNKYNDERITTELNNYILDELKTINIKDKISIEITTKFKMKDKDKDKLITMIKNSYQDDIIELSYLSKKLFIKDTIIFIFSIICLLLYYLSKNLPIMSDILLIVGWVLMWEVIYNVFFAKTENNIKIKKRYQVVNSTIIFMEKL